MKSAKEMGIYQWYTSHLERSQSDQIGDILNNKMNNDRNEKAFIPESTLTL